MRPIDAQGRPVAGRLRRSATAVPGHTGVSLRLRITCGFAAAMILVLGGIAAFIYVRLQAELQLEIDRSLGARADALMTALTTDGALRLGQTQGFADPEEAFAQILDRSAGIREATSAVDRIPLLTRGDAASLSGPRFYERAVLDSDGVRLLAIPTRPPLPPRIVVVGETLGDRNDALRQLLTVFLIAGPAGVGLASLAGWLLAGAALRPVERMRRRAAELSHADTRARLPVPRTGDELTRLATTLNDLLDRLHGALEREHRFVDDASHELRTPLAILKAELDLSMARPRTPAELQATVTSAARETDHLVRLAEDMLVLARVRAGSLPLRAETVHLPDLLCDAVAPMRPRAEELGTSVDVDTADSTVDVDPVRIRQAVQNLVDNALRHGSGPVAVAARTSAEGLRITVTDQGPGVPSDLLGTAFEPFTRGPVRSHGRPAGSAGSDGTYRGAGLGLAIVRAVAEAHGGTVTLAEPTPSPDSVGQGACIRIDLPLHPAGGDESAD